MNYSVALRHLNSLINYERWIKVHPDRQFNLNRMRLALDQLDHPERKFPSVLVAGTKGKGSTVAILASILRASGYRVGTYTSPHLVDVKERIAIDGAWISKERFARGISEIEGVIHIPKSSGSLTYFELLTCLAFYEFAHQKVDIAISEVGLGGKLDATNTLEPLVSVITSISYDHQKELGSTLSQIAGEKAGIIHRGSIVITSPQEPDVLKIISRRVGEQSALWLKASVSPLAEQINLPGLFQQENASTAIRTAHVLSRLSFDKISRNTIRRGLARVRWPGRFEIVGKNPWMILDGAHNGESMEALLASTRKRYPRAKIIPILGISQGKDLGRMIEALEPVTDTLILTEYSAERAWPAVDMARKLGGKFKRIFLAYPVSQAVRLARTLCEDHDVILVTGSLFLVGEFKKLCQK